LIVIYILILLEGHLMLAADLIVIDSTVYTLEKAYPLVQAFAVRGGRIAAVGSTADIMPLRDSKTDVIQAKGKTILPGFIDAHCHIVEAGLRKLCVDCSSSNVRSIDDIVQVLHLKANETPEGRWILAEGYDDTKLVDRRFITKHDLDKATNLHPIHLGHVSAHIGVVNSCALKVAGLSRFSRNPSGGCFERDADGELNGICREAANSFFFITNGAMETIVPSFSDDEIRKAIELECKEFNSYGITSVGEACVGARELKAFQDVRRSGLLSVRVNMMMAEEMFSLLRSLKIQSGFGDEWLRIGAVKCFADGSIAGRTAWLQEAYDGRPDYYGIPTKSQKEMREFLSSAHNAGFQIAVHANGDRAIEMVLDGFRQALDETPRSDHRHRIEHCTVVTSGILERIRRLGIVVLPFSTYIYAHGEKMREYGSRVSMMFAYRSFLDYGIAIGGSSDNPCATMNPLIAIQTMVTRQDREGRVLGPEQRIGVEEALMIYTRGSAYATFEENLKGSLAIGKVADFVVLSGNPILTAVEKIGEIRVEKTILGGTRIYEFDRT
jgi:predicted amidohydrolase YtcJ